MQQGNNSYYERYTKNSLCGKVLIFPRSRQSVSEAVDAFTADSHQRHISPCDVLQSTFKIQSRTDGAEQGHIPCLASYYILFQGWVGLEYGLEGSEIKTRRGEIFRTLLDWP
jgi:hypothetical protein